jgi:hypothetical protein
MRTTKKPAPFPAAACGQQLWGQFAAAGQHFVFKHRIAAAKLLAISLWLIALPLFAQTAERLDAVLDAQRVSFAQAAALILPASGLLPPDAGDADAFDMARAWLPRRAERDSPINMGELSHLVMRSFNLSGGFMYAFFPGPRYAYRALAWRRLLPPAPDPGRFLSGEELLYITGLVLSLAGDAEALEEPWAPAALQPEPRMEVEQGQGLSTGSEGVLPYEGEFELE